MKVNTLFIRDRLGLLHVSTSAFTTNGGTHLYSNFLLRLQERYVASFIVLYQIVLEFRTV